MKLLYCSDLHGSEAHYARLIKLAETRKPDVIILGGDMLPDDSALLPEQMGRGQPEFVRRQFRQYILTLREVCSPEAILVIPGNHDWRSSTQAMMELAAENLICVLDHLTPISVKGLSFLGYPFTPPTPWYVKDYERLDKPGDLFPLLGGATWDSRFTRAQTRSAQHIFESLSTIAEDLAALKPPADPWVFVAHAPPYESSLDRAYGQAAWGSQAIRQAIEQYQPLLSLHGHIHESPTVTGQFQEQIGSTTAINPGQARAKLCYAIIDIDVAGGKVSKVEHGQEE